MNGFWCFSLAPLGVGASQGGLLAAQCGWSMQIHCRHLARVKRQSWINKPIVGLFMMSEKETRFQGEIRQLRDKLCERKTWDGPRYRYHLLDSWSQLITSSFSRKAWVLRADQRCISLSVFKYMYMHMLYFISLSFSFSA